MVTTRFRVAPGTMISAGVGDDTIDAGEGDDTIHITVATTRSNWGRVAATTSRSTRGRLATKSRSARRCR